MKNNFTLKNLHLLISIPIVISAAVVYGFYPTFCFEIMKTATDQNNIIKAMSGLYLVFSLLWIYGVFNKKIWKTATISNVCFMMGLALGRIISMIIDGEPSAILTIGLFGELILGIYGIWMLKTKSNFID
jgi:drug/metabolite transporter superfamily protein YnfA